jgi:hypothetical protein
VYIKFCANPEKSVTETLKIIKRALGKERMESPISPRQKKVLQMKIKVKSLLIILIDIKGIVHKQFVLTS